MKFKPLINKTSHYRLVGITSATIHATHFTILMIFLPFQLCKLLRFLIVTSANYLDHSLFRFKEELGSRCLTKWLVFPFFLNIAASSTLPIALYQESSTFTNKLILVFTPTLLKLIIWTQAARFSRDRIKVMKSILIID